MENQCSEPINLLIVPDSIKDVLEGQSYKNHVIEHYVDEHGNWVLPEAHKQIQYYAPFIAYFLQMKPETARIDYFATAERKNEQPVNLKITGLSLVQKDPLAIDFKRELISRLQPDPDITNQGIAQEKRYYEQYSDEGGLENEILKEVAFYTFDESDPIPSARSAKVQQKYIMYVKENGEYATEERYIKYLPKYYLTREEQNAEGQRRRNNILTKLGEILGLKLVMTGVSTVENVEDTITAYLHNHSDAISTWKVTGKGTVYDDVENDPEQWLDNELEGETLRQTIIKTLRGE